MKKTLATIIGLPLLLGACTTYVPAPAYRHGYVQERPTIVHVNPVPVYNPAPVVVYERPYHHRYWHHGHWNYVYR